MNIIATIRLIIKNKYAFTFIVFFGWIALFDSNSLIDRVDYISNVKELEKDKKYYKNKITESENRLLELRTNKLNLEKFAREHYYMKKDNEDIFVFVIKEWQPSLEK